ncbi:MAG: hypothetical protein M1834_006499 [Cirrosporium novae-zelandiae]|nr:MAG: hypothetical protein M1834_006499 [Cirrosporium novae-zelandiae]
MAAAVQKVPDPAQIESSKLEDQAAVAALYTTKPEQSIGPNSNFPLDSDGKLSSAGAATSLKYADSTNLPSYPSAGLTLSSAGAAATLASVNQKPFEHWKPDSISTANMAALRATDYKSDPLWRPELSSAGSKAAILAHRDSTNMEAIKHEEPSRNGSSAAGMAMQRSRLGPKLERTGSPIGDQRALIAASGAMRAGNRKRSESTPVPNSYALNSAMFATSPHPNSGAFPRHPSYLSRNSAADGLPSPSVDASRIYNIARENVNRDMYGSKPPVDIEVDERKRQDTLRAAALSMAKQMYAVQRDVIDEATGARRSESHSAANRVHGKRDSANSSILDEPSQYTAQYNQYSNLEEAARKLAAERLAKLHDEHTSYRDYYGQTPQSPRSRLSIRGRRKRASSDSEMIDLDTIQSQKIRSQMSLFQDKVAQVDTAKMQRDREALMAAAQRNVTANMHGMDEKIFSETGKASPAMIAEWETAAKARAERDSEARMANFGKVHIGGGQYVDQQMLNAIAAGRIQPTLNEINEKAERHRALDEERRLDQEEKKRVAARDAQRAAEVKAEEKRVKDAERADEKARKGQEKQKQKAKQDEAKAQERARREAEKEENRIKKEAQKKEQRKSTSESSLPAPAFDPMPHLGLIVAEEIKHPTDHKDTAIESSNTGEAHVRPDAYSDGLEDEEHIRIATPSPPLEESPKEPLPSSSSPPTKMKSWFKGLTNRAPKDKEKHLVSPVPGPVDVQTRARSVSGSGGLKNKLKLHRLSRPAKSTDRVGMIPINIQPSTPTAGDTPAPSERAVAIAGRSDIHRDVDKDSISSISSLSETDHDERGRSMQREKITDSDDLFEEARDTFEDIPAVSPIRRSGDRHSKFSEDL